MGNAGKKVKLTDYIYILFKWKNFLISLLFIILLGSVIFALLKPNKYKATASIMLPANKDFGLGGLGGLLSGQSSALEIGTRLLGVTSTNEDMIQGFMKSKSVIDQLTKKYHLYDYYELEGKDRIYENLIDALNDDMIIEPNEYGFINVSVINKDSVTASKMVMDIIHLSDSLNIHFNILQAKNFREFVEKRYTQTLKDLATAEDNYYAFQKKYGVFDIPEQIKLMVESSSKLEAQVIQQELLLASLKQQLGENSPQYIEQKMNLNELRKQINKVYSGKSEDDFFLAIKDLPDLQIKYIRLFRELEIQNKTLEFIYPVVEQARIDEKKNLPTVLVIDKAYVPQKKYSPRRSFIVIGVGFFGFWILFAMILRAEKVLSINEFSNVVEEKEYNFYKKIASIFRIKV